MRSVADQIAAVLAVARPMPQLDVVLVDAVGRILAGDLTAGRDVPPVAIADRDGYAVRCADAPGREVRLPVVEDVPPTAGVKRLVPGTTMLVAAGAPVPRGADAVVALEDTDRGRAWVRLHGGVRLGEGVRAQGTDAAAGRVVLAAGTRLGPRHLALAAALGHARLWVRPAPRVVVVTVGDELVGVGRPLRDGTVHDADGHALVAAAQEAGAGAVRVGPLPDDRAALREVLADQMVRADLLVIAGGLSGGPWDTVADVLAELSTVRIDQVAMTPGGRQGFGEIRAPGADDDEGDRERGVLVAVVPGHPVAALVSFEVFLRPVVRKMAGYTELFRPTVRATPTKPLPSPSGLTQMIPGTVAGTPAGGYAFTPLGDPGRASLAALAGSNALAVVSADAVVARAGDTLPCMVLEA